MLLRLTLQLLLLLSPSVLSRPEHRTFRSVQARAARLRAAVLRLLWLLLQAYLSWLLQLLAVSPSL